MTAVRDVNPPDCPAQKGRGTDIIAADFGLAVRDSRTGDGQAVTRICGYFTVPGQREAAPQGTADALVSAVVEVPAGSPAALLARRVRGSPALLARAEDALRANITACRCQPDGQCPALNQASMLHALSHAAGRTEPNSLPAIAPDARRATR